MPRWLHAALDGRGSGAASLAFRDGAWRERSWADLRERVELVARGLIDLGIEPGDRVSILSSIARGVDLVRLRRPVRRRDRRADLPDQLAGRVRAHPARRRGAARAVRGRRAAREGRAGPRRPRRARARPADRAGGRRHDPRRAAGARRRAPRPPARRLRGPLAGDRPRRPVHHRLHVGHHRAAQGLHDPAPQLPRDGADAARADRRAVRPHLPVPAAGALVRPADPVRRRGLRRDARLLARHPADPRGPEGAPPHGAAVGAAGVREGLPRDPGPGPRVPRGAPAAVPLGRPGRTRARRRQPRRARARVVGEGLAVARRPARAGEDPRPARRPAPAVRLGRRAGLARDPRVLRRLRHHRARGLRPDRDVDRRGHQHRGRPSLRHRRPAARRGRRPHRRGRRDPAARRERVRRLLGQPGGDRSGAARRLAAHRRRGRARGRLHPDHRSQEGHHHHRRRQERHAVEPRERPQGVAVHLGGLRDRRPPAVPGRRWSRWTSTPWRPGPRPTGSSARGAPLRREPAVRELVQGEIDRVNATARADRAGPALRRPGRRVQPGERRAHADA